MKLRYFLFVFTLLCVVSLNALAELNVASAEQQFSQVRQLDAEGKTEQAIDRLTALIQSNPDYPSYKSWLMILKNKLKTQWLVEASTQLEERHYDKASQTYLNILKLDKDDQFAKDGLVKVQQAQNHELMLINAESAFGRGELTTAQNILRSILAENPSNSGAKQLFEKIENRKSEKVLIPPKLETSFKKTINLEFKDAPIKSVFEYIGKAGKLNFTFDQEMSDNMRVNVLMRDTSIDDALDVILTSHQLGKKVLNQNTLLIYPISRTQDYQELFVRSFYLNNLDAKQALNLLKVVLKVKDVYVDEKLNSIVMRDSLENIQNAEKLIGSQDLNVPEVMLEVEVMEVNRRNLEQIGVQYPTQVGLGVQGNASANSTSLPTKGTLSLTELRHFNGGLGVFTVNDPAIVLNLLQQDTDTNLLANPKIRVKNRDKAKIHVGDKIPVLTSVANSQGFVSQTVNYLEVGIKLDVEPTIQLQDQVSIKVGLEVSNITDQVKTDNGVLAYTIGSRNATTTLQLKNNETQILAGLFRDDAQNIKRKVPGLGNLPIIGRLFRDNNQDKRKNEVVLLITPRILHNLMPASATYTMFPSGVDRVNVSPSRIQGNLESSPSAASAISTSQERPKADMEFGNQLLNPSSGLNSANTSPTQ